MRLIRNVQLVLLTIFLILSPSLWADDFDNGAQQKWMLKRLMKPSQKQRDMEERQKLFMYVGLRDWQIDRAMDKHFDRIENFMIANVVKTDASGIPLRDKQTGAVMTEVDGCD